MNFTSQICTTEEQSKRLLALGLKVETADMSYKIHYFDLDGILLESVHSLEPDPPLNNDRFIPAWSLNRLIELSGMGIIYSSTDNIYDKVIQYIEYLIKYGNFNKKYLKTNMAIKIIKPGRKKIPIYSAKCSYCKCEFEFNKEDFKIQYDRDGEFGQIDCPHCANTVTFSNRPKRYSIVK